MSKGRRRPESEPRAVQQMERRPASVGGLQAVDPITVGPDRSINIDLKKLAAPLNTYDADFAWIVHRPGAVSLFFGKAVVAEDRERLRTRLEIRYPPENLVNHFWKNSRRFHARLKAMVGTWPWDEKRDSERPQTWPSDRDHSEVANFESMAHAGTEACLDFYLLPATGIARFTTGQGSETLSVVPVVRVYMTVFELLRFLNSTEEVVAAIKQYMPTAERVKEAMASVKEEGE
jgi:hypothetical protein